MNGRIGPGGQLLIDREKRIRRIAELETKVADLTADVEVVEGELKAFEAEKVAQIDAIKEENYDLRERYVERHKQVKALIAAQDHDLIRENQRLTRARDSAVEQAKRAVKMCTELRRQLDLAKSDALIERPMAQPGYNHHQGGTG